MKVIYRYLALNFVLPFLISTLFFVVFLLTFQMFSITKLVIKKSVGLPIILELMSSLALTSLPLTIPIAALFATIYVLNRLSSDSEIIAMRSFGHSKYTLTRPFLHMALLISFCTFSLHWAVIPNSNYRFKEILAHLTTSGLLTDIRPESFYTDIPGVTLFARKVSDEGRNLGHVFLNIQNTNENKTIFAQTGTLFKGSGPNTPLTGYSLKLTDGNILKENSAKGEIEKIIFHEYTFPLTLRSLEANLSTKHSMRSTPELWQMLKNEKIHDADFIKMELEFYGRINGPLSVLAFVFLGVAVGIQRGRGKKQNSLLASFIILAIYYALYFTGISLARGQSLPALVATTLPLVLTLSYTLFRYRRLDWNS